VLAGCSYDASGLDLELDAGIPSIATIPDAETPDAAPRHVSFEGQVKPLFLRRGCLPCHSDSGVGEAAGGLKLDGSADGTFKELTDEESPRYETERVDLDDPEASILLKLPLADEPDPHPISEFKTTDDPDYQLLLAWIREGAPRK
jgi:hypothetical protein